MAKKHISHRIYSKSTQKGDFMEQYTELFKPSFLKNEERVSIPVDATPTMAYIPLQLDLMSYETDKALCTGTLFPTLDKPFLGRRAE